MAKSFVYYPTGTCSQAILTELEGEVIANVQFVGGCSGNTPGVASLANGRPVDEVISLLSGIRCGSKATSCPDQLACALQQAKNA